MWTTDFLVFSGRHPHTTRLHPPCDYLWLSSRNHILYSRVQERWLHCAIISCVRAEAQTEIAEIPHFNGPHELDRGWSGNERSKLNHIRENFVRPKTKNVNYNKTLCIPPFEFGFFLVFNTYTIYLPAVAFCYYYFFHPLQDVFAVGHEVIFSLVWQRAHKFPTGRMITVRIYIYI